MRVERRSAPRRAPGPDEPLCAARLRAELDEQPCLGLALAAGRARDDRNLACQVVLHVGTLGRAAHAGGG